MVRATGWGGVQGRGLHPLLYVMSTIPLHRDMPHTTGGIKGVGMQDVHVVGTLTLIEER